ncbi:hypothetical protein HMPREF9702_00349 [Delftia acidovorans CCUG 15835]|nr:hypothetical protein HMPREF9702_00349 [Delftia acidovorans CCUG 15835]
MSQRFDERLQFRSPCVCSFHSRQPLFNDFAELLQLLGAVLPSELPGVFYQCTTFSREYCMYPPYGQRELFSDFAYRLARYASGYYLFVTRSSAQRSAGSARSDGFLFDSASCQCLAPRRQILHDVRQQHAREPRCTSCFGNEQCSCFLSFAQSSNVISDASDSFVSIRRLSLRNCKSLENLRLCRQHYFDS